MLNLNENGGVYLTSISTHPGSAAVTLETAEAGSQGQGQGCAGASQALRGQLSSLPHVGAPQRFDCIFQIVGSLPFAENGEIIGKYEEN